MHSWEARLLLVSIFGLFSEIDVYLTLRPVQDETVAGLIALGGAFFQPVVLTAWWLEGKSPSLLRTTLAPLGLGLLLIAKIYLSVSHQNVPEAGWPAILGLVMLTQAAMVAVVHWLARLDLPERPKRRFQFGILHLVSVTFVAGALLAAGRTLEPDLMIWRTYSPDFHRELFTVAGIAALGLLQAPATAALIMLSHFRRRQGYRPRAKDFISWTLGLGAFAFLLAALVTQCASFALLVLLGVQFLVGRILLALAQRAGWEIVEPSSSEQTQQAS